MNESELNLLLEGEDIKIGGPTGESLTRPRSTSIEEERKKMIKLMEKDSNDPSSPLDKRIQLIMKPIDVKPKGYRSSGAKNKEYREMTGEARPKALQEQLSELEKMKESPESMVKPVGSPDYFDKFKKRSDWKFDIGKHKGKTYEEVYNKYKSYFYWVRQQADDALTNDLLYYKEYCYYKELMNSKT